MKLSAFEIQIGSTKDSEKQHMCHYDKASAIDIHPQKTTFVFHFASVNYGSYMLKFSTDFSNMHSAAQSSKN